MIRIGNISSIQTSLLTNDQSIQEVIQLINNDPIQREAKLSGHIERHTINVLLVHFFEQGQLLSPTHLQPLINDEEYIAASLGWAQELARYALHQACLNDLSI
jgi:hypothetical protein